MEVTRSRPETQRGPEEWFTGEVWLDPVAEGPSRLRVLSVHFTPGARTAWHRHPYGQVLYITEGSGLVGTKEGSVERIQAGDTVHFDPDEEHWHGAQPKRFMTHIALQEVDDDGNAAYWGERVGDEDYLAEPAG
jgi:quercetin dioxygenase-like cupin family protein